MSMLRDSEEQDAVTSSTTCSGTKQARPGKGHHQVILVNFTIIIFSKNYLMAEYSNKKTAEQIYLPMFCKHFNCT